MKINSQTIHDKIFLMTPRQHKMFTTYLPDKVYPAERNIAILVALFQLGMIITFLSYSKPVWTSPRAMSYFILYVSLFTVTCPIILIYRHATIHKKYKLFIWTRRIYSFLLCCWVVGITFLEQSSGKGITVFCYFLPCAAAIILLYPTENIIIFGTTWIVTTIMLAHSNTDNSEFFGNFVNTTFVAILTIFISYRYYQSMAKEFCARETIATQYEEIQNKNTQLQHMVYIDQLTGLYNRRYLLESIYTQFDLCREKNFEGLLMMLDIDYFKKYNDSYGHVQGDECLRQVSKILSDYSNSHDASSIRYGGEEFMIVKMAKDVSDYASFANDLQQAFSDAHIPRTDTNEKRVTISIGLWHGELSSVNNIEEAIKYSDAALYNAKESGRNKTVIVGRN